MSNEIYLDFEGDWYHINLLTPAGSVWIVEWGDGTTTTHYAEGEEQHIRHTYPEECIGTGKTFVITISSDEDNIAGISINDEFNYMDVNNIDISGCQSLKYFGTT